MRTVIIGADFEPTDPTEVCEFVSPYLPDLASPPISFVGTTDALHGRLSALASVCDEAVRQARQDGF